MSHHFTLIIGQRYESFGFDNLLALFGQMECAKRVDQRAEFRIAVSEQKQRTTDRINTLGDG